MNVPMYINQAISHFTNISSTAIELRPGQILQGTVLKLLSDKMATVQLGSLLVTARLEAALEPGQNIWLQVQPEQNPITLRIIPKPSNAKTAQNQAAGGTLSDLAKAVSIPLTKNQLAFLGSLFEYQIPVSTELMKALPEITQKFGASEDLIEVLQIITKKGLPLTENTIRGIRAFQKNENVSAQMDHLLQNMQQFSSAPDGQDSIGKQLRSYVNQLVAQLQSIKETLHGITNQWDNQRNRSGAEQEFENLASETPTAEVPANATVRPTSLTGNDWPKQTAKAANAAFPIQFDPRGTQNTSKAASRESLPNQQLNDPQPILRLLQQFGMEHERQILQASMTNPSSLAQHTGSVKAAILQLLQSPEAGHLPHALKQDMQQLVDHITGQQLMASDNTPTAFVQYTVQFPMPGLQRENAWIHIESKKKGEKGIDKDNCRLFFYLTMEHMGETILDVSIINTILTVTLYNNQTWIPGVVQHFEKQLRQTLADHGYVLSNIKIAPLPASTTSFSQSPPDSITNYKGVDIRI
ncbi:hypothetical protein LSG31_05540 [Fodinisporobacter ferrooxydans]|uniref:Flagellar hook-length control protein-like C-terminal domain-containing protein n=1 Tax=Fodinisporobacter ferrooxydans TaxID=2901836 RepID=A0ABY4CQ67_9BACL|nr:hypothetical protein LSG31_05540 [Alicyclobacillaceae bacterium MYW30-H2]